MFGETVPIFGEIVNETRIVPIVCDHDLEDAVDERNVAALRDREPVIGDVGAEERAV